MPIIFRATTTTTTTTTLLSVHVNDKRRCGSTSTDSHASSLASVLVVRKNRTTHAHAVDPPWPLTSAQSAEYTNLQGSELYVRLGMAWPAYRLFRTCVAWPDGEEAVPAAQACDVNSFPKIINFCGAKLSPRIRAFVLFNTAGNYSRSPGKFPPNIAMTAREGGQGLAAKARTDDVSAA